MAKCSHQDCNIKACDTSILNGHAVQVCTEHKRTTELGNWEGIQFNK